MRYWPTEAGDYAVHVICDDEDIKDSPFMAHVLPAAGDTFPQNVRLVAQEQELLRALLKALVLRSGVVGRAWRRSAASSTNRRSSPSTAPQPAVAS